MSEFDFLPSPLGIPGNPLDGTPGMQSDLRQKKKWWALGDKAPLQPPGRLDFHGQADVGTPMGTKIPQEPNELSPREIFTPDTVSATDPAYSAHPVIKQQLAGLSRVPTAAPQGDVWSQTKPKRSLTTNALLAALQPKGMDALYKRQGASAYG
jgi:hypothetical protein